MGAWSRVALLRRVIVNLDDGSALRGLLWRDRGPLLVLKEAELLQPGVDFPVALDGEAIVERSRVLYVQAL